MVFSLPEMGADAIPFTHFPTKHQAFIFRAYEYVEPKKIAEVLGTSEENVRRAAAEMGLPEYNPGNVWLKRGYITIIRRMWHILPYDQLLLLLDMEAERFARLLREEDFLDIKLSAKPVCEKVSWRELTPEEKEQTREIKRIMDGLDFSGKAPFEFEYEVPTLKFEGAEKFSTRMIYAFSGLYQGAFDIDSEEYLPDEQLIAYQKLGINGIWTQAILSQLTPYPFDPSVSEGYEARLERVRAMTERLAKYGIKLYLYLNEPRGMPLAFFEKHPELMGHQREDDAALCVSTSEVQNYLKDSVEALCRAVPQLGGIFTITKSENLTNCYSKSAPTTNCPRCKDKTLPEVIATVIQCLYEGVRRVSDDIKVFAWSWAWYEYAKDIIPRLPKGVILISQSEKKIPCEFGGVRTEVRDYSMSIIGPGDYARAEWATAKSCGLEIGVKVQINTTWEASTVPAIPVSPSIEEHIRRLQYDGIEHLLLSWTLGGYPCNNIAAAAKYFYESCSGHTESPELYEAEKQFVRAFSEFPFDINVLYRGPQNAGPSTLLFEKSTGYNSTMTCYAYDSLERWRGIYPLDVFEGQLRKLCDAWEIGLKMIPEGNESEIAVMAKATYCLFKSSLNQTRFICARDEERYADAVIEAKEELEISREMFKLMNKNAAIGYEAANHYYFSKGQLAEKIVNCHYIIDTFSKKASN